MTANTTQRLGLMLPQDTDPFTSLDFRTTFGILDGKPGITPVANYAALPTNLTSNQHGSCYIQLDNGAMWYWYRPGSAAGSWKRANSLGVLQRVSLSAAVTTASTSSTAGPTDLQIVVTAPGGRWLQITAWCSELNNDVDPWHSAYMGLFVNNTLVQRASAIGSADGTGSSPMVNYYMSPPAVGTTVTAKLTHYSQSHGGNSTMQPGASMAVIEL